MELTVRRTGERTDVPLADAVGKVAQLIANGRRSLDDRADAIELLEGRC